MPYPYNFCSSVSKIGPTKRRSGAHKPDGSVNDNDRVEIGPTDLAINEWEALGLALPDLSALRTFRLQRIVGELVKRDLAGVLLFDPLNIRYATDSTNMQLWITHNHARACYVAANGHIVLWDFHSCDHLSAHLPLVKELRHGASFFYFESGDKLQQQALRFAQEVQDIAREHAGDNQRIAVDKIEIAGLRALDSLGMQVMEGQEVMEQARLIKGPEEIKAMRCSLASTEISMAHMQAAAAPGLSENDIWSVLHAENIRRGGEWIECRILSSGPRTNPWFQESGPRVVQAGELLAYDTDLIGPYGICADLSRTFLIGDGEPSSEQKHLYRVAHEHIQTNMQMLKPGLSALEVSQTGHRLPKEFRKQRYGVMMHGVGLCDEYPSVRYPEDVEEYGYDLEFQPGMALCVEAYVGAENGKEGVKLEDQVIITETGFENLTKFPFEENLLAD